MRATCVMSVREFIIFLFNLGFDIDPETWKGDILNETAIITQDHKAKTCRIYLPHQEVLIHTSVKGLPGNEIHMIRMSHFLDAMMKLGFEPIDGEWASREPEQNQVGIIVRKGVRIPFWIRNMEDDTQLIFTAEGDEPNGSWVNDCEVTIES